MKLTELPVDTPISFILHIGDREVPFESKITEVNLKRGKVYAEAVIQEGRVVTFKGIPGIYLDMYASFVDEKPILFPKISVIPMKNADNTFCYELVASEDGKPHNRRAAFRCFVGADAAIAPGVGMNTVNGVIRDVSTTGFSVVLPNQVSINKGQVVYSVLEDLIGDTDKYSFSLYGVVVRVQPLETGRTVYGCKLNKPLAGLDTYVAKKERSQIKERR